MCLCMLPLLLTIAPAARAFASGLIDKGRSIHATSPSDPMGLFHLFSATNPTHHSLRLGDIGGDAYLGDFDTAAMVAEEIGDLYNDFAEGGDVYNPSEEIGDVDGLETGGLVKKVRKLRLQRANNQIRKGTKKAAKLGKKMGGAKSAFAAEHAAQGGINPTDQLPFVSARNFIVQYTDVFKNKATFPGYLLKGALDRSQLETPSIAQVVSSNTPGTEFGTSNGVTPYYIYAFCVIKLGVSKYQGIANQTVTITIKLPLFNGTRPTLVIVGQLTEALDATITVFPFTTVQGSPVFVYGKIGGNVDTSEEILLTVAGMPSGAVASLIVPFSGHTLFQSFQAKVSK